MATHNDWKTKYSYLERYWAGESSTLLGKEAEIKEIITVGKIAVIEILSIIEIDNMKIQE